MSIELLVTLSEFEGHICGLKPLCTAWRLIGNEAASRGPSASGDIPVNIRNKCACNNGSFLPCRWQGLRLFRIRIYEHIKSIDSNRLRSTTTALGGASPVPGRFGPRPPPGGVINACNHRFNAHRPPCRPGPVADPGPDRRCQFRGFPAAKLG